MGEPLLLKGAPVAARIREEAARDVEALKARNVHPHLAFIYPESDGGARSYADSQRKSCEKAGIGYTARALPEPVSQAALTAAIESLRDDPAVTGILLHQPWPKSVNEIEARLGIGASHDVEGLHPHAMGLLALGAPVQEPCTAAAAIEMLKAAGQPLAGKDLVIVGRSPAVGRALALLLLKDKKTPTITICHTATADLGAQTRRADVLVVAAGRPGLVTGEMVKEGAVVIDVGTNVVKAADGTEKLVGDVDFASVAPRASAITPVPGGVGPVTSALLLRNIVMCARQLFPE